MKCEELDVWKRSATLSSEIYLELSMCKDYGFKDQITRSGLSIPSNIAEGLERNSDKDTLRFLDYARASSAELQTQIYIGIKINYIDKKIGLAWIREIKELSKMTNSLMRSIKNLTTKD